RLQKLEEQLQELLKEVQALRSGGPKPQGIFKAPPDTKPSKLSDRAVQIIEGKHKPQVIFTPPPDTNVPPSKAANPSKERPIGSAQPPPHIEPSVQQPLGELTLTRAVYKLPHAKAEALANLLMQHTKVDVLETKVEGDRLIVTTTTEAQ